MLPVNTAQQAAMADDKDTGSAGMSDSESDDSDFEEVEGTAEDQKQIEYLEADLKDNPRSYDSHVQVCAKVRSY